MTYLNTMIDSPFLRRCGALGFAFFLIKGLLWLLAPFVFYFAATV